MCNNVGFTYLTGGVWRYLRRKYSKLTFFMPNTQLQLIGELRLLYLQKKKEQEYIQRVKENTCLQLIKELCILYSQREKELKFAQQEKEFLQREKQLEQRAQEILCFNFLDNLHHLYQQEKERLYNQYIYPFLEKYSFLNKENILGILKKEGEENFHSCFLAKFWDCRFVSGRAALTDFLKMVNIETEWYNLIETSSYTIETEHATGKHRKHDLCKKRIDLLIKDDEHKWLICIENKINSKVHADKKSGRDQLEIYEDYSKRTYPDYKQLYILLSHVNNKYYAQKRAEWQYMDYYAVMKSLLKYSESHEIIQDYLKVLYSLLFHHKQFDSQLYNESTSLYDYNSFINQIISKIY